jgi:hypothetical protein
MYEEIYKDFPSLDWEIPKSHQNHSSRGQKRQVEDGFQCQNCWAFVYTHLVFSGVRNRNHCPYCLWSRHMDHLEPGDRLSACKAIMQPIGLTVKQRQNKYRIGIYGELMLIHRCKDCSRLSINRIAADDQVEKLMELYQESLTLDRNTREQLEIIGIHLLQKVDESLVVSQLLGYYRI